MRVGDSEASFKLCSIEMWSPFLGQDLGFGRAAKDCAIEQLMMQAAVKRFTISSLLRSAKETV